MIKYKSFIYLSELNKYKSIKTTAKKLEINPITLDKAILNIEKTLGEKIIEKSYTGINLTSIGVELLNDFKPVQDELDYLIKIYTRTSNELIVCTNNSFLVLDSIIKLGYYVKTKFINSNTVNCIESIINGDVDISFLLATDSLIDELEKLTKENKLHMEVLYTTKVTCCVGKSSTLLDKNIIYKNDIKNKTHILLSQYRGNYRLLAELQATDMKKIIYIDSIFDAIPFLHQEDSVLFGTYINSSFIELNNIKIIPYGSSKTKVSYVILKKTPHYTENERTLKNHIKSRFTDMGIGK